MIRLFALIPVLFLAACGSADLRVAPPQLVAATADRVSIRYHSVEVTTVTMPVYAASEEIVVATADGSLAPLGPLWSDEPARAMTLEIAEGLGAATNKLIAPSPWPFRDLADARLDIRVADFYATQTGLFRISGQYFVAPEASGRNVARSFAVDAPIGPDLTPSAIAAARAEAIRSLVAIILRDGLR